MMYGLRIHDRPTEDDPCLATVMYADDERSTWYDMATGHPDYVEEILGALEWREEVLQAERDRDMAENSIQQQGMCAEFPLQDDADGDIVDCLLDFAEIIDKSKDVARMVMLSGDIFIEAACEIKRLRALKADNDGWQATAAGLSEDIGNAEDEIERLSESLSNALRLLAVRSEARRG